MRHELKRPFGKLIRNEDLDAKALRVMIDPDKMVITCGDETTKVVQRLGIKINMAIIDHKTKREDIKDWAGMTTICRRTIRIINPPAVITSELAEVIRTEIQKLAGDAQDSLMLDVDGEEDLAFIPCVVHSPNGTAVLYGQPNEGMVMAIVDDQLRKEVGSIYDRMETITQ